MKRTLKLFSSALLFIMVILYALPAAALDYRAGANGPSGSYISGKYYENLASIPLTGDGAVDVCAVALSQLGYREGGSLSALDGATPCANNYTEYNYNMGNFGIGYGGAEYHWCASFVSFCLYQSRCHDYGDFFDCARFHESDTDYIWREISCEYWVRALKGAGRFYPSAKYGGKYTPETGDLIFYSRDGKTASHVGIVLYTENGTVYTVEGNTNPTSAIETNGEGVYAKSYKLTNPGILGYGKLPYKTNTEIEHPDHSGRHPGAGLYISGGVKYLYLDANATVRAGINLPAYTVFHVNRVAFGKGLGAVLECEYKGEIYFIKNNSDRIYRLTCESEPEPTSETEPAVPDEPAVKDEPEKPSETKPASKVLFDELSLYDPPEKYEKSEPSATEAPHIEENRFTFDKDSIVVGALSSSVFGYALAGSLILEKKEKL